MARLEWPGSGVTSELWIELGHVLDGKPNAASTELIRGAFDFGARVNVRF
jgi:hypothetical protein